MNLATGTKLGPYEILGAVGAGGMGEVYRARDTRLGRTVAVKVLPSHLAARLDFRERFEREARAASSLNHPNICVLFDIGSQDGIDFIVMEYLEGETLESRLAKGSMPLDQALRCAISVADALAAAHGAGITHRDLKPSNIMLTKSGPKLLDFGLAKSQPEPSFVSYSQAPTEAAPLTSEGVIIGTLQYMSPEQIDGREISPRTDIFAFGVVLYEMITGRKAFEGKSQMSLLAAILEREPPAMSVLQEMTPPALEHLVRGCLAKAPEERWQSTRDIEHQLRWILESGRDSKQPAPLSASASRRRRPLGVLAVGVLLAAVVLGFVYFREPRTGGETIWVSILPPHERFGARPAPALSPDGKQVAFWAPDGAGDVQLWIRSLDSPTARVLAGATLGKETANNPTGALPPFWSPDGGSLGFFVQSQLKRVDVAGGLPQQLAAAPNPFGGTWNRDGVILFSPYGNALYRISASGGTATPLYPSSTTNEGTSVHWPRFLPDGRHFLFFQQPTGSGGALYLGSLDSKDIRKVLAVDSRAEYADGHIFFGRNGELFAQAFDLGQFQVTGEAFRVADRLGAFVNSAEGLAFSASSRNVAIWSGAWLPVTQLTWYDRSGKRLGPVGEAGVYGGFDLSPDGQHAAIEVWNQKTNVPEIWLSELATGIASRFATTSAAAGASTPLWTRDGSAVFFNPGDGSLHLQPARGTQVEKIPVGTFLIPESVSRDGMYVFLTLPSFTKMQLDLGVLPLSGNRKVWVYELANQVPSQADPSPDGHWIAYMSNESGTHEIYVQSFPKPGNKKRISANVGIYPKWSRNGKELYFLSYRGLESTLMVSTVTSNGSTIDFSLPHALFAAPLTSDFWLNDQFAPSPKGDRFLFNALVDSAIPPAITVISNWRRPN